MSTSASSPQISEIPLKVFRKNFVIGFNLDTKRHLKKYPKKIRKSIADHIRKNPALRESIWEAFFRASANDVLPEAALSIRPKKAEREQEPIVSVCFTDAFYRVVADLPKRVNTSKYLFIFDTPHIRANAKRALTEALRRYVPDYQ